MGIQSSWNKTITFDRFIKGCIIVVLVVGIILLLKRLSSVLLPFFIGWLLAYLMNPLVNFFQKRCRFKYRILGIIAAFIVVGGVLYGAFLLIFPPMWQEILKVKDMLVAYLMNNYATGGTQNFAKYSDPQVDALLTQLSSEFDVDKRAELAAQIDQLVLAENNVCNMFHLNMYMAMKEGVEGLNQSPVDYYHITWQTCVH